MDNKKKSLSLSQSAAKQYLATLLSVIAADKAFTAEEMTRIYSLFAILEIDHPGRIELIEGPISCGDTRVNKDLYSSEILVNDEARTSLAKDLLFLESKSNDSRTLELIQSYLRKIKLEPEQASVLRGFVTIENQILEQLGAGKEWQADPDSWKELVSRAAAVGVPLAALNMAGIAGFSAVGITSGLAALGSMSGLAVLGLSPMTAGIGALILGGVAIKKIADYALSGESTEQSQLHRFQESRLAARSALIEDLPDVRKGRKRELLLFLEEKSSSRSGERNGCCPGHPEPGIRRGAG